MGLMDRWGRRGEGDFRGGAFWVGMVEAREFWSKGGGHRV